MYYNGGMKKLVFSILLLTVLAGGIVLMAISNSPAGPDTYTNSDIGLRLAYPAAWDVVSETALSADRYWVHLQRDGGELGFEITLDYPNSRVGGFTLPDERQTQYKKLAFQDGTPVWRPRNVVIASTTDLRKLPGQPSAQAAAASEDRHAFGFIFPNLNQTNNIGETFDGGNFRIQKGSSTLAVTGGIRIASSSQLAEVAKEIDEIISSASFKEGSRSSVATTTQSVDTTDWQTYSNPEYDFSLQYPKSYHEFSSEFVVGDEAVMHATASSSGAVLTPGGYNRYPQLDIKVLPMNEYEYNALYGTVYRYDASQDHCVAVTDGEVSTSSFDISAGSWGGCGIGTGDAGAVENGYFIPRSEDGLIIEITESSYYGTRRPLDFDTLIRTLKFN